MPAYGSKAGSSVEQQLLNAVMSLERDTAADGAMKSPQRVRRLNCLLLHHVRNAGKGAQPGELPYFIRIWGRCSSLRLQLLARDGNHNASVLLPLQLHRCACGPLPHLTKPCHLTRRIGDN